LGQINVQTLGPSFETVWGITEKCLDLQGLREGNVNKLSFF